MFTQEFISKLGTKSLSKDPAKTLERINAAWNRADKEKQQEVLALASVPYSTAYRVRKQGTITTKMTIAYSQALDLDPYYLIGAVDENAGYSFESAKKLLKSIGAGKLVKEFEKTYTPPAPPKDEIPAKTEEPAEPVPATTGTYSIAGAIQKLNEEDLLGLFKALIIKAGVGKPEALEDMTKITEILMK